MTERDGRRLPRGTWRDLRRLVPESGQVDRLVEAVATRRGRPIRVLACRLEAGSPTGWWLRTAEVDFVVHAQDIAAEHRRIVVCHELAHMLLDHAPSGGAVDTAQVAPSIAPEVAARFFARHGYHDDIEAQAELLATRLATALARRVGMIRSEAALHRDPVSARLR